MSRRKVEQKMERVSVRLHPDTLRRIAEAEVKCKVRFSKFVQDAINEHLDNIDSGVIVYQTQLDNGTEQ